MEDEVRGVCKLAFKLHSLDVRFFFCSFGCRRLLCFTEFVAADDDAGRLVELDRP